MSAAAPPGRPPPSPADYEAILRAETRRGRWLRWSLHGCRVGLVVVVLAVSLHGAKVSPRDFWRRLPQLGEWLARLWPPDLTELWSSFLPALWETLAIAVVGTALALVVAFPLAVCVARTTTPFPWLSPPLRALLNVLRSIDTAIFALIFVAVVGLGPFAGALGVAFHTTGSMAKLYAEALETIPLETREAVEATGAGRMRTFAFAVLPEAMPGLAGITLYLWEFNVRSSVILGIVGAGGIGYELMVSVKLLDFPRLATILLIILATVTLIDAGSAWLRKRLG
jgi:phosphonate transport system permease protein